MTSTLTFNGAHMDSKMLKDILLDYIVMINSSGLSDNLTQEKLQTARYLLKKIG